MVASPTWTMRVAMSVNWRRRRDVQKCAALTTSFNGRARARRGVLLWRKEGHLLGKLLLVRALLFRSIVLLRIDFNQLVRAVKQLDEVHQLLEQEDGEACNGSVEDGRVVKVCHQVKGHDEDLVAAASDQQGRMRVVEVQQHAGLTTLMRSLAKQQRGDHLEPVRNGVEDD